MPSIAELKEIIAGVKAPFWENLGILNRSKGICLVEACNLRDKVWHNITPFCESVTVNHNDDGHSTCSIGLNNRHFELTGKGLITENFGARIFMGYRDTGLIYQGEYVIDTPKPDFPENGFPKISLSGKDMLIEASDNEEIQVYNPGTNEDVMFTIAQSHGWEYEDNFGYYDVNGNYIPDDPDRYWDDEDWRNYVQQGSTSHGRRVRSAESEYAFMKQMAVESGNVLFMSSRYDQNTGEIISRLHFHKPKPKKELTDLWYRCPYNPLLNNILSISPGEITYKRAQSISTGGTNTRTGEEIFAVSGGQRTPLDRMMIEDNYQYPKDPYDYRRYGEYEKDKYAPYTRGRSRSGSQQGASSTPYYQRRAIYETISAIERGRIPDQIRRKYRHIPHLLRQQSGANASRVVENIDSSGHFILECQVSCIYGLPYIFRSDIVRLLGAHFYDGLYYVKSISHSISQSDSLKSSLDLRGNSTWATKSATNYDNEGHHYDEREPGDYEEDDFQDQNEGGSGGGGYGKEFSYHYKEASGFYYDFYGAM